MPTRRFAVTWDYRCPFARNAAEHVMDGLLSGADWDVRWVPFSLGQVHVAEGEPDVWDEPDRDSGLLALRAGVVVRDRFPERFLEVNRRLFAARHDEAAQLGDRSVVAGALAAGGVDADAVLAEVDGGWPLDTVRKEHEEVAVSHSVWGVPTFMVGDEAAFVRLMDRPAGDGERARASIERVVDLLAGWPELNEFKHTSIRR